MIALSEIKENPGNPRHISKEKLDNLKKSIKDFERMMELRPMVIDEKNILLGGNMRYRALKELGYKEVPEGWIKKASDLTEKQKKEFIIKDNVGFGEWDWEVLANEWDDVELQEWGLNLPDFDLDSDEEKDIDDFSDQLQEEFRLEVNTESEKDLQKLYNELKKRGYQCQILTL